MPLCQIDYLHIFVYKYLSFCEKWLERDFCLFPLCLSTCAWAFGILLDLQCTVSCYCIKLHLHMWPFLIEHIDNGSSFQGPILSAMQLSARVTEDWHTSLFSNWWLGWKPCIRASSSFSIGSMVKPSWLNSGWGLTSILTRISFPTKVIWSW